MWQNTVQPDRPQMTKMNAQKRFDLHAVQRRQVYTGKLTICYTDCISTV